jgi:ankyrin repeat protein
VCTDVDGKVPLVEALIARDTATVKLLWENGATLKKADRGRLLGQAALDRNVELIKDYINYGADVNESNSEGLTPLHIAVMEGQVEIVKTLLSLGAYAHIKTDERVPTPCELALQNNNNPELMTVLRSQPVRDDSSHGGGLSKDSSVWKNLRRGSSTVDFQVLLSSICELSSSSSSISGMND